MPQIREYTSVWSGFTGSPGYTKFRFAGGTFAPGVGTLSNAVGAFWDAVHFILPAGVGVSTTPAYKTYDADTGALLDQGNDTGAISNWVGTVTGPYSGTSGACLGLDTTTIGGTRRIRGRMFIVPLGGSEYDVNGTLSADAITRLSNAAAGLKSASADTWAVWRQPVLGAGGLGAPITGTHVNDRACILRSRRQ